MAAPSTATLDDYNRANGAVGSNWTALLSTSEPLPPIVSNKISATSSPLSGFWNPTPSIAGDAEVWAIWGTHPGTTGEEDLWLRASGLNASAEPNAGYMLSFQTGNLIIYKADGAGALTSLASVATTGFIGTAIGTWLLITGTTLTGYTSDDGVNWTSRVSIADGTYTAAGRIGYEIYGGSGTASQDSFGGGAIAAASAGVTTQDMSRYPRTRLRVPRRNFNDYQTLRYS